MSSAVFARKNVAWDLDALNETFDGASPETIVRWALAQNLQIVTSTSFGSQSAAMLHLVNKLGPFVPTLWIDSGFAPANTREFNRQLVEQLDLNLVTYRPKLTPLRCLHAIGAAGTEDLSEEQRAQLANLVKIEPFERAMSALKPHIWLTGIRAEETSFRAKLRPASWDDRGILKLAPFLHSSEADIDAYLTQHKLPTGPASVDPTKAAPHLECGLHTRRSEF
ncbi:MAG: phosphoadenosine phosphosulfate reductase family protein [Luminiphilus sp.]|nr:phosphoadenosine phosphosulfate reductase family protein [Luminiphilus sp.]